MSPKLDPSNSSSPRQVHIPITPALPNMTPITSAATPTRPSPLRDELSVNFEEMKIRKDEEFTPPDPGKLSNAMSASIKQDANVVTTPPDSNRRDPTIVDGSSKPSPPHSLRMNKPLYSLPKAEDDVFGSTPSPPKTSAASVSVFPTRSDGPNEVAKRIESSMNIEGYNGFTPREDRRQQAPSAANAQGLYPPDALVFVANLSNQRSEDQLEISCHHVFDGFGKCHIKVRRDKNKQPFCFVQFEKVEHANDAINRGTGLVIDGRTVRLERAKAERAVILSRSGRSFITEREARSVLEPYGSIEMVRPITAADSHQHGLPQGAWVKFAYYLDCRDALRGVPVYETAYRIQLASEVEPRVRVGLDGSPVFQGFGSSRSPSDLKSIFVGNLPEGTTQDDLRRLFTEFGPIVQTNVIRKLFSGNMLNIFGFVEFSTPQEADRAARAEKKLHGSKLRIEPKEYSTRRQNRQSFSPATPIRHMQRRNAEPYFPNNVRMQGPINSIPQYYQMAFPGTSPTSYTPMHLSAYHHNNFHGGFNTPPSVGRLIQMGLFSPPLSHMQYHGHPPPYGTQQPPQSYGNYMQPISETTEDEHFAGL